MLRAAFMRRSKKRRKKRAWEDPCMQSDASDEEPSPAVDRDGAADDGAAPAPSGNAGREDSPPAAAAAPGAGVVTCPLCGRPVHCDALDAHLAADCEPDAPRGVAGSHHGQRNGRRRRRGDGTGTDGQDVASEESSASRVAPADVGAAEAGTARPGAGAVTHSALTLLAKWWRRRSAQSGDVLGEGGAPRPDSACPRTTLRWVAATASGRAFLQQVCRRSANVGRS